ncbi:phage tail assembly protein [Pseudomonas aeruginosa]|uniref:phage tail assembly protein n=1 Tax=Pseudomonas aeruginosa TaxID=287 RepID=UPI001ADD5676|nr:phage tail assembly protein [Pseudomonas aeruginosa]MBO8406796.1 phage tail assembly protein [Pseudomonas aeruginosa]MBS9758437.1 phage tail assembly protein [Pseudomonas aeruginosa]MBW5463728.1 phage tail assembly protein [Pseudomonas aeruginosa]HBO8236480.1 phage tail assembly protein [Pseudomonas aeruginosa]
MEKITYPLSAPIKAHGEELTALEVRRPTPQECRAIKVLPYNLTESGAPAVDTEAAAKYIAVCAAIPASSVNQLDLYDLNKLAWMITGFFMRPASTDSDALNASPSTSPTTGE